MANRNLLFVLLYVEAHPGCKKADVLHCLWPNAPVRWEGERRIAYQFINEAIQRKLIFEKGKALYAYLPAASFSST